MTRAKLHAQKWWEDAGQDGMDADKFNGGVWGKNMSARFPEEWRDKQDHEHSGPNGGPIVVAATDLTDEQLAAIAAR